MQPPPVIYGANPLGMATASEAGARCRHTHTRRTPGLLFSGRVLSIEAGPELESALAEELTDNAPDAPTLAELATLSTTNAGGKPGK